MSSQVWQTENWLDEIESGYLVGGSSCLTGYRWHIRHGIIIASPWPHYVHVTSVYLVSMEKDQRPTLQQALQDHSRSAQESSASIRLNLANLHFNIRTNVRFSGFRQSVDTENYFIWTQTRIYCEWVFKNKYIPSNTMLLGIICISKQTLYRQVLNWMQERSFKFSLP